MKTNIFIVDDSEIILEGLKMLLLPFASKINVVGKATNCTDAFAEIIRNKPDVVVLDISLEKDMDGIDLAVQLKTTLPNIKIIFLSHHKQSKYLWAAFKAGADAYLSKDLKNIELINTIETVMKGNGLYFGESIPKACLLELFGTEEPLCNHKMTLTAREIEVVNNFAKGYCSKEIARILSVETSTIESHKERIKEKLNVKNVVQIVVWAIKKGLISV
jgi:two-component system response regulator NreC